MKITIIEDEETLSLVLEEKFKQAGFTTQVIADGESAVKEAEKTAPDMILLDLVLPHKGGVEVLKDLKSNNSLKHVPVIVISNLGEDETIKKCLQLGAMDYFVKSNHPIKEIVEKVKDTLLKTKMKAK